jgi:transcriptional regulator
MAATESVSVGKGTLDVLVLRALSWGALHGFEIFAWIEDQSGEALELDDSAIYHALYRMEARGLLEARWGVTDNARRARYYECTAAGKAHLRAETKKWIRYSRVVTGLLTTSVAGRASK